MKHRWINNGVIPECLWCHFSYKDQNECFGEPIIKDPEIWIDIIRDEYFILAPKLGGFVAENKSGNLKYFPLVLYQNFCEEEAFCYIDNL